MATRWATVTPRRSATAKAPVRVLRRLHLHLHLHRVAAEEAAVAEQTA